MKGKRFLEPLFFANLFFYAFSGLLLASSALFFFSAFSSLFPLSALFLLLGLFALLCLPFAFFSFFWREPAVLLNGGWPLAMRSSYSLFTRESAGTVRLWLFFFMLEALAGFVSSGGAFVFLSLFLGILVSAYTRLAKICVFLDAAGQK